MKGFMLYIIESIEEVEEEISQDYAKKISLENEQKELNDRCFDMDEIEITVEEVVELL